MSFEDFFPYLNSYEEHLQSIDDVVSTIPGLFSIVVFSLGLISGILLLSVFWRKF